MAATDARVDLRAWSVATFRTITFVLILVLVLHLRGTLRARLALLDTLNGAGAFVILWATTVWATRFERRCLQRAQVDPRRDASPLEATIVAGAVNGAAFFLVVATLLALRSLIGYGYVSPLAAFLIFSIVGSLVALVVGGFVGLAYGLVEGGLARLTARVASFASA